MSKTPFTAPEGTPREDPLAAIVSYSDSHDSPKDYLKDLLENWRLSSTSAARTITASLVLAALFELLSRAAVRKVSVGPVEIGDLSLIQKALPVIIAYQFYDFMSLTEYTLSCALVHSRIMSRYYPAIEAARLDYFIVPRDPSILGSDLFADKSLGSTGNSLTGRLSTYLGFTVGFGIAVFEVYAYYRLFRQFHFSDLIVWITLTLTVFFVLYGLAVVIKFLAKAGSTYGPYW
jgi:hypothetical protein